MVTLDTTLRELVEGWFAGIAGLTVRQLLLAVGVNVGIWVVIAVGRAITAEDKPKPLEHFPRDPNGP